MGQIRPFTSISIQKKLKERLLTPYVHKDCLSTQLKLYKIKLRTAGYRLVYQVIENQVIVSVIVIAKRDKNYVYEVMQQRLCI